MVSITNLGNKMSIESSFWEKMLVAPFISFDKLRKYYEKATNKSVRK